MAKGQIHIFFFCSRLYSAIAAIIQTVDLKRIECVRAEGGFCYASKGGYKKRSEYFIQKLDYVLSTRFVSSFGVLEGTTNLIFTYFNSVKAVVMTDSLRGLPL